MWYKISQLLVVTDIKSGKKMKEKDTQTRQTNLFQNKLSNLLDLDLDHDHELIPWTVFEETF
ncbi:MAG: hypothetical protein HAW62_01540 [Endozoicomonadaceae bacterium]|nr:hypothetical protein [Endozoicomonadaceae bacterium]